jgi:hypothetical protein
MSKWDGYRLDLVLAFVLRGGLLCGILAIMAMISGCSPFSKPTDILPSMSGSALSLRADQENQTRSHIPQRGCDEKSDSSLTKPLL